MLSADGVFGGARDEGEDLDEAAEDGEASEEEETERGRDEVETRRDRADDARDESARNTGQERVGARVLDLYAGTGALAFEALSRGAESAVLVEQAREAVAVIRDNARTLGADAVMKLVVTRVDRALTQLSGPFDLVFADPPYADVRTPAFSTVLERVAALVAPGGVFVLEHASGDSAPTIPGLSLDRSRRYGDTTLSLYRATRDADG